MTWQAPKELLSPLFRTIATYNSVTNIIEGVRALVLDDWRALATWKGYLTASILFVVMVTLTMVTFRKTLS